MHGDQGDQSCSIMPTTSSATSAAPKHFSSGPSTQYLGVSTTGCKAFDRFVIIGNVSDLQSLAIKMHKLHHTSFTASVSGREVPQGRYVLPYKTPLPRLNQYYVRLHGSISQLGTCRPEQCQWSGLTDLAQLEAAVHSTN